MTPEQQAAYVIAQAACVTADVAAMQAENAVFLSDSRNLPGAAPWKGEDFRNLIEAYGIHHNAVIGFFR